MTDDLNLLGGRDRDRDRDCDRKRDRDCNKGCGGMDSSMLFFFLLLVIIFCGDDLFGGFGKKKC